MVNHRIHDTVLDIALPFAADPGHAKRSAFYRAFVEWMGMAPVNQRRQWSEKAP